MHFDQKLHLLAHRFPNRRQRSDRLLLGFEGDEQSLVVERVSLERGHSLLRIAQSVFSGFFGSVSVPPSIRPDAVSHHPAQQFVHRDSEGLALDIPQRHLDAAYGGQLDRTASHEEVVIERLPVLLDAAGVLADDKLAELLHHRGDGQGPTGRVAPPDYPLVGLHLHIDVVPGRHDPVGVWNLVGRAGYCLDGCYLHGTPLLNTCLYENVPYAIP